MTVLVALLGVVVALLAVLVVGLLRSHAEILRQLHELGAGAYAGDPGPTTGVGATEPEIRTQPGVPTPRDTLTPAFDLSGVTPRGSNVAIGVVGRPHPTLLAFLTSGCTTCSGFWQAFADGQADELPGGDTRLVVVTRGPEGESPATVAGLASERVTVVMSSEAWQDYKVPVSPYFVLVDGPGRRIIGEGAGTTWPQVASLLEQACADAGLTTRGRPRPAMDGPGRERRADEELLRAGIGPGHPSLYGQRDPERGVAEPAEPGAAQPGRRTRRRCARGADAVSTLRAHGLRADLPSGWEGEIYVREQAVAAAGPGTGPATAAPNAAHRAAGAHPVLQLANFALPPTRGDFGGGAVELMGPRHIFISLFDHGPESVGTALFASKGPPWPVHPGAFGPNRLQRPLPGQGGAQWFFTDHGRPFCLYVVIGSHLLRGVLARPLNHVLSTIRIT